MAKRLRISEEQTQAILWVRAFEEADPEGRLLPLPRRKAATEEARQEARKKDAEHILRGRALSLLPRLDEKVPFLKRLRRVTRLTAGALPWVALLGLLLGLSTSALGSSRSINLLSIPLLGLIAWNLLLYLIFALVWILKGRRELGARPGLAALLTPLLTLGALKRAKAAVQAQIPDSAAIVGRALAAFLRDWREVAAPLVLARSRRLLHAGAFMVMTGVLGGMYLRGLVFEYQATWESTFLDVDGVQHLLATLLTPALALTGGTLPPLPAEGASGPAAPWIHLFTLTGAILVLAPRGLLMLTESLRIANLRRRLPLEMSGAYFRRILASGRGDHLKVLLMPYSTTVPQRHLEKLQTALLDLYGSRAALSLTEVIGYGEDPPPSPEDSEDSTASVVIFSLAQTPEAEVHGDFLANLPGSDAGADTTLVVLDEGPYRHRLGEAANAAKRLEQRRQAWGRILREAGSPFAFVHLAQQTSDELHRRLTAALEEPSDTEPHP